MGAGCLARGVGLWVVGGPGCGRLSGGAVAEGLAQDNPRFALGLAGLAILGGATNRGSPPDPRYAASFQHLRGLLLSRCFCLGSPKEFGTILVRNAGGVRFGAGVGAAATFWRVGRNPKILLSLCLS